MFVIVVTSVDQLNEPFRFPVDALRCTVNQRVFNQRQTILAAQSIVHFAIVDMVS